MSERRPVRSDRSRAVVAPSSTPVPAPTHGGGCFRIPIALASVFLGTLYILNLGFGFDLIPDNIPIFGNLDEAGATAMILFGLRALFRPKPR